MLTLYYRPGCLFYHKLLDTIEELGINVEERDISDPAIAAELVARGSKLQVPYLVDSERAVEMYESMNIIAYLREHYPKLV